MKEFKRLYKMPEKPPLKLEGKDHHGNLRPIKKTFLSDDEKGGNGQGTHGTVKREDPKYLEIVERTYEYLKSGLRSNEILATLMVEDSELTEKRFMGILKDAYRFAENALHKDREYLFQLHMQRYEDIFKQSMSRENAWHRPLDSKNPDDWKLIIIRLTTAMKALKAKEDLLGLHDKSMVIEFNEHKATVIRQERVITHLNNVGGHDFEMLSTDELIELLSYIKKIRTVPLEGIQRVSVKQFKIEIGENGERKELDKVINIDNLQAIEIVYEDMPENVVDKFEEIREPEQPERPKEPNVIDAVPKEFRNKPVVSENDIKQKLQNNLLEQMREKLKNK